ncbi:2OG-Fe(II) oxygenase [Phormidesmis sp. 146-35]
MTQLQTAPFVQLDRFLKEPARSRILEAALSRESEFVATTTSTGETDYRRSRILYQFPDFNWMVKQVELALPQVMLQLGLNFAIAEIEIQLTAHNDGHYYKIHNDSGSPDAATRLLSYVYYFHRQPKAFSGGELRLYDSTMEYGDQSSDFCTIEPQDDRIIFFPSDCLHEVMPVVCPSRAFADGRFTLNGWVRSGSGLSESTAAF